jgi:preprotein translocase subunit SecY
LSKDSNLPIRVNQAGMIPIIFAVSMLTFPVLVSQFIQKSSNIYIQNISSFILNHLQKTGIAYTVLYFALIIIFTFFYVSITFNPDQIAENIQKRGAFIPGIRPGKQTSEYIGKVSNAMNLFGGVFIAFIATIPLIISLFFEGGASTGTLLISGSGLIIIVGVILDLARQLQTELMLHHYKKLY